jgi:hypothetical protein
LRKQLAEKMFFFLWLDDIFSIQNHLGESCDGPVESTFT